MRIALLFVATLSLLASSTWLGCGPRAGSSDPMMSAVRGYNENIRWRRFPEAATRIPHAQRDPFLDERESLDDDLRVDDYEIKRVKMGQNKRSARVQIRYTWHRDSRGLVHKTTALQQWERLRGRWFLAQERRVRGKTMPGLAEPLPRKRKPKRPADAARKTAQKPAQKPLRAR